MVIASVLISACQITIFFLLIQMWNSRKIIALQDFRSFQLFEPLCLCVSFGRAHPSSEISRLRPTSHRLLFLKPCSMIFQGKLTQFTVVVTISHQPSGDLSQWNLHGGPIWVRTWEMLSQWDYAQKYSTCRALSHWYKFKSQLVTPSYGIPVGCIEI